MLRQEQLNDVQVPVSLLAASARAAGGGGGMSLLSSASSAAQAELLGGAASASHVRQQSATKLPPYDPTCPVSVAMSKLKSLMDHADPTAAAAAAEEEAQALAEAEEEERRAEEARKTKRSSGGPAAEAEEKELNTAEEEEEEDENEVPLECLRYFKLLNRGSQRSLMKQLICQLQRTACTPRDSLMGLGDATPRFLMDSNVSTSLGIMRELLPGYGYEEEQSESNNDVDPNCFEVCC